MIKAVERCTSEQRVKKNNSPKKTDKVFKSECLEMVEQNSRKRTFVLLVL